MVLSLALVLLMMWHCCCHCDKDALGKWPTSLNDRKGIDRVIGLGALLFVVGVTWLLAVEKSGGESRL